MKNSITIYKKRRVLSLFSGGGGLDLGFEGGFDVIEEAVNEKIHPEWFEKKHEGWVSLPETSFETVFANDIDENTAKAWNRFFSKKRNVDGVFCTMSIVDLVKKELNGEHILPKNIDVVTGGFPCNDFSVAGKRNGFASHRLHDGTLRTTEATEESRGKLYMWMKQVVEIVQPKVFFAENVKGLVSLADVKQIIENDFREISGGYVVVPAQVLYAPSFGVPQTRERVIFIGFKKSALLPSALEALQKNSVPLEYDPYPVQTHGNSPNLLPYTTVAQALKGLGEPAESNDLSHQKYSRAKFMGKHCQGQKEIDMNLPGPTIRAEHHGNIEFRRLSKEHGGILYNELATGLLERRLSVRECARIQTFPDEYEFVVKNVDSNELALELPPVEKGYLINSTSGYRIVGNAVPPLLGYHLATRLDDIWAKLFGEDLMSKQVTTPSETDFINLLEKTQRILEVKWANIDKDISQTSPDEFEKHVADALNEAALGSEFENTIKLVTGHRFPDISIMDHYGVEVKSTKSNHWKTLGNSVLESTRIKEIETIYIFFAQLLKNPKLKFRKYQDCLSEVQITHSPRYMIDMNLEPGQSIFAKMGMDYDTVRLQERPISLFIDYYKRILGKDTSVWWINNDGSEKAVPMQISFWSDLTPDKKHALMGYLLFLFPEVFMEKSTTKYKRPIIWLVKNHSIVSACMRDDFSAGGRVEIDIYGKKASLPQIINCLLKHADSFRQAVLDCSINDIQECLYAPLDFEDSPDARFHLWFDCFCDIIAKTPYNSEEFRKYIFQKIWRV